MAMARRKISYLIAALVAAGSLSVGMAPAVAQMSADCIVGISNRAPYISCGRVVNAEARGRADCAFAPDTYTRWVRSWQSSVGGRCLFSARGAILEVRRA